MSSEDKKPHKRNRNAGNPASSPMPAAMPDRSSEATPAAGPHARPDLTDPEKTPGAGSLPEPGHDDVSPGTG